jgi:hypothetical protein
MSDFQENWKRNVIDFEFGEEEGKEGPTGDTGGPIHYSLNLIPMVGMKRKVLLKIPRSGST